VTKIIARLGLAAMALSIGNTALALPAVQSAHFRRHSPIRSLETWHGRRHQPIVHGVRRFDAQSGLPTGKRIHKPI
jgi:hypothetical protein